MSDKKRPKRLKKAENKHQRKPLIQDMVEIYKDMNHFDGTSIIDAKSEFIHLEKEFYDRFESLSINNIHRKLIFLLKKFDFEGYIVSKDDKELNSKSGRKERELDQDYFYNALFINLSSKFDKYLFLIIYLQLFPVIKQKMQTISNAYFTRTNTQVQPINVILTSNIEVWKKRTEEIRSVDQLKKRNKNFFFIENENDNMKIEYMLTKTIEHFETSEYHLIIFIQNSCYEKFIVENKRYSISNSMSNKYIQRMIIDDPLFPQNNKDSIFLNTSIKYFINEKIFQNQIDHFKSTMYILPTVLRKKCIINIDKEYEGKPLNLPQTKTGITYNDNLNLDELHNFFQILFQIYSKAEIVFFYTKDCGLENIDVYFYNSRIQIIDQENFDSNSLDVINSNSNLVITDLMRFELQEKLLVLLEKKDVIINKIFLLKRQMLENRLNPISIQEFIKQNQNFSNKRCNSSDSVKIANTLSCSQDDKNAAFNNFQNKSNRVDNEAKNTCMLINNNVNAGVDEKIFIKESNFQSEIIQEKTLPENLIDSCIMNRNLNNKNYLNDFNNNISKFNRLFDL